MKSSIKLTIPLVEMLVLLALTNSAKADAQTQYSFDLPRQSLASTLEQLAQTANTKLVYSDAAVQGLSAAPVQGRYTVTQALARALNNSGMQYQVVDNTLITLKAAPVRKVVQPQKAIVPVQPVKPLSAVSPVSQEVVELAPVTVVGYNDDGKSYSVESNSTAMKTDTPIMQTPFSVQVVPQQVQRDQQAVRLEDITKNVSGVQTNWGYGSLYEGFALRGFETNNTLRNGQRIGGAYGRSTVDVANLDHLEVLKGPAAMIYGRLDPGGMINAVTKKPLDQPYYSLQQQFGSYDFFRTTADATGPVTKDGSLLYRVNFAYLNGNTFKIGAPPIDATFVAPSLTWKPTDKLAFNLNYEYRNANPFTDNGVPAIGNKPANIPISFYGGDVNDKQAINRHLVDFNWSYAFNNDWKLRNGMTATFDDVTFRNFFPGSLDKAGNLSELPWFIDRTSQGYNTFLDLTGNFKAFGADHAVLAGTDHYVIDHSDKGFVNGFSQFAATDSINIFNPVHNRINYDAIAAKAPDFLSQVRQEWNGVYFQDQITLWDKLHLLLGGRYDWATMTTGNITLPFAPPGSTLADINLKSRNDEKFSPRFGMLYQPVQWLSVYGNYVQSLGASNSLSSTGAPLPAQESESYEAGLKAEGFDGRLTSTLAFFHINKSNLAIANLQTFNPADSRAIGEATSEGIEFDVSGQLTEQLSVIGNYAFTDARISKDTVHGLQGHRLANVPEHSGSVWLKFQATPEFSFGAGTFIRGTRQGNFENTLTLPGYARVDAYAAYSWKIGGTKLTTQVNVNNLLDKRYYKNTNALNEGVDPKTSILPGEPLTVLGSVRLEY